MKVQSSENKLVNTEEFIFDQNKLPSDPNNHFNIRADSNLHCNCFAPPHMGTLPKFHEGDKKMQNNSKEQGV